MSGSKNQPLACRIQKVELKNNLFLIQFFLIEGNKGLAFGHIHSHPYWRPYFFSSTKYFIVNRQVVESQNKRILLLELSLRTSYMFAINIDDSSANYLLYIFINLTWIFFFF